MRQIMEQLGPGDHAALFYRNRQEQFAAAIPYIQIGLARNERCLYIAGENSVRLVIEAMQVAGIDVAKEEKAGKLIVASQKETYLRHGIFEPEKMIEGLGQEIELTLSKGFSAFRGTGELGWAVALPSALLRLYEYEALFDANLGSSFVALCQYDETLFKPDIIAQVLRVHPKVVARGKLLYNSYYISPSAISLINNYHPITLDQLVADDLGQKV